jgi:CBS domain-containing protein
MEGHAMPATIEPLLDRTAANLMTTELVRIREDMPLRDAAGLMHKHHISGAPVVDRAGKCVGVLSAIDVLRVAVSGQRISGSLAPARPVSCSFQVKQKTPAGQDVTVCTLPPGVCPIQVKHVEQDGTSVMVCSQPNCVLADWQVVELEKLPNDPVSRYMTADPVTARPSTPIRVLAQMMIDARIHRVIVVDEVGKPVGIVSSTDALAALAYA